MYLISYQDLTGSTADPGSSSGEVLILLAGPLKERISHLRFCTGAFFGDIVTHSPASSDDRLATVQTILYFLQFVRIAFVTGPFMFEALKPRITDLNIGFFNCITKQRFASKWRAMLGLCRLRGALASRPQPPEHG